MSGLDRAERQGIGTAIEIEQVMQIERLGVVQQVAVVLVGGVALLPITVQRAGGAHCLV